jgi:hypothetical protein
MDGKVSITHLMWFVAGALMSHYQRLGSPIDDMKQDLAQTAQMVWLYLNGDLALDVEYQPTYRVTIAIEAAKAFHCNCKE